MFTEQAQVAIVRAQDEARGMGHSTVQVEHLLLGLCSDQDGIAGRVLADFGLTIDAVRDLVRRRPGAGSSSRPEAQLPFSPEAKDALRELGAGSAQDSVRDQEASLAIELPPTEREARSAGRLRATR